MAYSKPAIIPSALLPYLYSIYYIIIIITIYMSYCHTHPYYPTSMGMGREVEKYSKVSANMT